jgi:hypothetical protein
MVAHPSRTKSLRFTRSSSQYTAENGSHPATVSQSGTKLTGSAFPHLPAYRIEGQEEDEKRLFAKARQR